MMPIKDYFEQKARATGGVATMTSAGSFAVAYATLELAEQQSRLVRALDALGSNNLVPTAGPGTTEYIGMQLERIAAALESQD